jgi:hypothetical protein
VNTVTKKMEREKSAFEAAREAGLPITPLDVATGDKPDLRVLTSQGLIGIEMSEVLPLPRNATFNSSVAEAANHEGSVLLAERTYYKNKNAVQVKVTTYPRNVERTRNIKRDMGDELASFVRDHCHEATPTKLFTRLHGIPDGFGVVSIHTGSGSWAIGQCHFRRNLRPACRSNCEQRCVAPGIPLKSAKCIDLVAPLQLLEGFAQRSHAEQNS